MQKITFDLDMSLKSENPTNTGVWFRIHHGMSMVSYGEKIAVTLTPDGNGTHVHILSECGMPTQLVDYGETAKMWRKSSGTLNREYRKTDRHSRIRLSRRFSRRLPRARRLYFALHAALKTLLPRTSASDAAHH